MSEDLNFLLKARREKLDRLRAGGIEPFAYSYDRTHSSLDAIAALGEAAEGPSVSVAGRLTSWRSQGKTAFAHLADMDGRIQLYFRRDEIGEAAWALLHEYDLGDWVGVRGTTMRTRTGEATVRVVESTMLSKSLRPLPYGKEAVVDGKTVRYSAFADTELRARQRYADLAVHPEMRALFRARSLLTRTVRHHLDNLGYLEVETPVLQPLYGGASARPFITHHNTLDMPLYLRIADELYLKRLIVGGFERVYEIGHDFRNEGMDRTHNPEFTILEFYVAYKDYFWMMNFTEEMLEKVAVALHGTTDVVLGDKTISFKAPFKRIGILDSIKEETGFDLMGMDEVQVREVCTKLGLHTEASMGKGKLIDNLFSEKCEGKFIQPTFIIDYPEEMSPLTKKHRTKPGLVERFELMVNGKELANAYTELNDPLDQRKRFEDQVKLMERGDDEAMFIDHDFLRALEYGMPPTSGIGIGIDRLCMFMTNSPSIQDVLFFPQMKPEVLKVIAPVVEAESKTEDSSEVIRIIQILRTSATGKTSVEILAEMNDAAMSKTKLEKILNQLTESKRLVREGKLFSIVA